MDLYEEIKRRERPKNKSIFIRYRQRAPPVYGFLLGLPEKILELVGSLRFKYLNLTVPTYFQGRLQENHHKEP